MSQALESDAPVIDAPPPAADTDIETRARVMGWKPLEEYRGPPHAWRDAAAFVERGETELPIMRQQNRKLTQDVEKLREDQGHAVTLIRDLTDRFRTADQRAYDRARADILAERKAAVEAGDTAAFDRAEARLADTEKTAPKPVPTAPAANGAGVPVEVIEWSVDNPWFETDPTLKAVAMSYHNLLLAREPTLSLTANLAKVTAEVQRRYPDRFPAPGRKNGFREVPDEGNPRRDQPGDVTSSSAPRTPTRADAKSFATLPADSKANFRRYKKMLEGKGKPITEEEWAAIHYEGEV